MRCWRCLHRSDGVWGGEQLRGCRRGRTRSKRTLKHAQGIVEALAGFNDGFVQQIPAVLLCYAVHRAAKLFKLSEGRLPPLCSLVRHANRASFAGS